MSDEVEPKSLAAWRHEIKVIGKKHYLVMFEQMLGTRVSNIPLFYRALNNYGDWYMFEAIVESSNQKLTGDPLNYVVVVAKNLWKKDQLEEDAREEYEASIKRAKKQSKTQNLLLDKRIKMAKRNKRKQGV